MWAKYKNSRMVFGREPANVHEIGIERDDSSTFHQTHSGNAGISDAGQSLLVHTYGVVAALNQIIRDVARQVFIGLEPH
jgi:hypothetical protein